MTTVTQVLRERTQARHLALEQTRIAGDLMSPQLTLARYVEILSTWVGAWTALEDCIWTSAFASEVSALLPSRRSNLGQEDLRHWQTRGYAMACADVPIGEAFNHIRTTDKASLLGVCYVVRGASLGGQVIARHLTKTLRLSEELGMTFFKPLDVQTPTWPAWSRALEEQITTPAALERAVVLAEATFIALEIAFSGAVVSFPSNLEVKS